MKKIFVITGQTATGKTGLAIRLAKKHNGELINADSHQIYKGLDIITGKDKDKFGKVRIHLYDIVNPNEYFSSYDFKVRVEKLINDIIKRGKTPIVVGGTYLYISHLLYGIETENIRPDFKLRERLKRKTVSQLQAILKKLDTKTLLKLNNSDRNNPVRLIRRIEILGSNKKKALPSTIFTSKNFNIEFIGLHFKNKTKQKAAISKRVEKRLKQGAVDEFKKLIKKGYKLTDLGLKATGCREISEFLAGKLDRKQLIEKWTTAEMNYAKRQYTFMKRDKNIKWITPIN